MSRLLPVRPRRHVYVALVTVISLLVLVRVDTLVAQSTSARQSREAAPGKATTAPQFALPFALEGIELGMRIDDLLGRVRLKKYEWVSCYYDERDPTATCDFPGASVPWTLFALDTLTVAVDRLTRQVVWVRAAGRPGTEALSGSPRAAAESIKTPVTDADLIMRLTNAWGPARADETGKCAAWGAAWNQRRARRALACRDSLAHVTIIVQDGQLLALADSSARVSLPWLEVPWWASRGRGFGSTRQWWPVWRPLGIPAGATTADRTPTLRIGAGAAAWMSLLGVERSSRNCNIEERGRIAPLDTVAMRCRWRGASAGQYRLAGQPVTGVDLEIGEPTGAARSVTLHIGPYADSIALRLAADTVMMSLTSLWGKPLEPWSGTNAEWFAMPFRAEMGRYCVRTGCAGPNSAIMLTLHMFTLATDQDQRDEIAHVVP